MASKKSLYGLKQSGRNWNNLLHTYLIQEGFSQSMTDPCVYTRNNEDTMVVLLIWVDDIVIAASDHVVLTDVKNVLKTRFNMTDLGQLSWFLGIQFKFEDGSIKMNQSRYLEKILSKYDMGNCKPRSTPSEQNLKFSEDNEVVDVTKYREKVGSLVYAMTCTRPDLSWIVTKLSQYLDKPTVEHHTCVKHVLRYIKGTLDYELCFQKSDDALSVVGYADADWGGSEDRKSTTGYCFRLGDSAGPVISWKSKRQQTVALSTCEAEYMALTSATQEGIFLVQLLNEIDSKCKYDKFSVCGDNQGALALAKNPVSHQRSKHIDIKYHFIRSKVQCGELELVYVPSKDNVADIFTKSTGKIVFQNFVNKLFGKNSV